MTNDASIPTNADITRALEAGPPEIRTFEYDVEVPGGTLHVYEHVAREAWMCSLRHAALLIPGPIATAALFCVPVAGFDAAAELLRAGHLCLTVDLLGTGRSSRPRDGRDASVPRQTAALAEALRRICAARELAHVDLIGESWGGAIASQLAAASPHVRSAVMVSTTYRTPTPALDATARDPRWKAMLDALPDGYVPIGEQVWGPLASRFPRAVADWVIADQVGSYPAAPLIAIMDLPYFDPSGARGPGLVIHGGDDDRQSVDDARDLAAHYGAHGATLVSLAGAGHIPRLEAAARDAFWDRIRRFLAQA